MCTATMHSNSTNNMGREVRLFDTLDDLSTDLADHIAQLSDVFVRERGSFSLVLSGGSNMLLLLRKLGGGAYRRTVDWPRWVVLWAEENVVPRSHPLSHYRLAREEFLSKYSLVGLEDGLVWGRVEVRHETPVIMQRDPLPWCCVCRNCGNRYGHSRLCCILVHRRRSGPVIMERGSSAGQQTLLQCPEPLDQDRAIPLAPARVIPAVSSHLPPSTESVAEDYEFKIRQLVRNRSVDVSRSSDCPRFDLVLLSLSPDGSVALLHPEDPLLVANCSQWVAPVKGQLPTADGVTMTLPVINAAANVVVVGVGSSVAEAAAEAVDGGGLPAGMVAPTSGKVVWFLEAEAAALLRRDGE